MGKVLKAATQILIAPFRGYGRLVNRFPLHWLILSSMVLGILYGLVLGGGSAVAPSTTTDNEAQQQFHAPYRSVWQTALTAARKAGFKVDTSMVPGDDAGIIDTKELRLSVSRVSDDVTQVRVRVGDFSTDTHKAKASAILSTISDAHNHVITWIKPVGSVLFLNLLKMIAVPLVLFSLVAGVASLNDMSKVGRIGGKTILIYVTTTAFAITIGLLVVNIIGPGSDISPETRESLRAGFVAAASQKVESAQQVSILEQLLGIVPTNPFEALSNAYNGKMLQVVFFALLLGIALTRLAARKSVEHVVGVFQLLSDAIIEMVHLIMKIAPLGVFALMAGVVADLGVGSGRLGEMLGALAWYMGAVVIGLITHGVLVYGFLLTRVAKFSPIKFLKAMVPAQLLAFSSSSSGATLPVTIDCVEKGVGVDEEVSSFVLPVGATINMDGTGLYQGVAAVFIATVYNIDLSIGDQLMIVLTATMASIGTAAVPGVGIVMLTIVLAQINVPAEGIALILGVDRPLDMCRTVLNVTGDATVATVVASTENAIHPERRTPTPGGEAPEDGDVDGGGG